MTGHTPVSLPDTPIQQSNISNPFSVLPPSLNEKILNDLSAPEIAKSSKVSNLWNLMVAGLKIRCQDCTKMIKWRTQAKGAERNRCEPCHKKAMEIFGSQKCIGCQKKITEDNCVKSSGESWLGICSACYLLDRHMYINV
jgi:hypothetical protein